MASGRGAEVPLGEMSGFWTMQVRNLWWASWQVLEKITYPEVELGFSKCASRISVRAESDNLVRSTRFFFDLELEPGREFWASS